MKLESSHVIALYAVLMLLGTGYNFLIADWERRKYLEGFVSIAVAFGVMMILAGVAVVSWQAALLCLGAFIFGGGPMMIGSIWRYVKSRWEGQQHERQAAAVAKSGERGAGPGC